MAPNQGNRNSKKQNQQQSQKKGNGAKSKKNNNQNNQKQTSNENFANELIGREEWVDTPPNLELLEQLLHIYPLRRDLWLACIRSLNGRYSLKKLLSRDQRDFFSWPLMPRRYPVKQERNSNFLAIDCEMIQTRKSNNFPARFSIVGYYGKQLLNVFIEPDSNVVNWRTSKSGMSLEVYERAGDEEKVVELWEAVDMIEELLAKYHAILVGHNIISDLRALGINDMPEDSYLDTQKLGRYKNECGGNWLKRLVEAYFNVRIQYQSSGHDPLEDARASMMLFRTFQREFHAVNELEYRE